MTLAFSVTSYHEMLL